MRRKACDIVEELYTKARYFARFDVFPSETESIRLFDELSLDVELKSSPGFPYVWNGVTTNRQLLENPTLRKTALEAFLTLMRCLRAGRGLPMPFVRIFVKPEPHKIEKIHQGRYRLIWALPFEYQLVHRLFFGPSLDAEIANFRDIPSKGGMSFVRGGTDQLYSSLDDRSSKIADGDKKSWDISVPAWLILMDCEVRLRLCLNPNPVWEHCVRACYDSLLKSYVIFSDGTVLEQTLAGIVRSGSMITLSGNSRMQVILKVLFCLWACGEYIDSAHRIIAIGDDTLERLHGVPPELYQKWLTVNGFTCHDISIGPMIDRVFCSHAFKRHGTRVVPLPTNWKKHCYALCRKEKSKLQFFPEQLFSLMLEYCFDDEHFRQLRAVCAAIKPEYCHSQQKFQNFVTGLESDFAVPVLSDSAVEILRGDVCSQALVSIVAQKKDAKLFQPRLEGVEENPGPVELELLAGAISFVAGWTMMILFTPLRHPKGLDHETKVWLFPVLAIGLLLTARASAQSIDEKTSTFLDYNPAPQKELPVVFNVLKPFKDIFNSSVSRSVGKAVLDFIGPSNFGKGKGHEPQRETVTVMPPKPKGKGGQKKMQHQKTKRKAQSTTVLKETIVVKKSAAKRKTHAGGNRLAYLKANRFNMDTARFGGRDLVMKVGLSGATATTTGKDVAGTVLYKVQIRPSQMIPNVRLARLMSLFLKWRLIKARFTFKSSLPSATNAGTMLFVHEPDPNEIMPEPFVAPSGGTLSNYDSHTVKALVPMAKIPDDFKGERNDFLDLGVNLAKGPSGGWFMVDPENMATPIENSLGQFAIFVQDAHNVIGSSGSLPTEFYEIGSLFFEYDIEVQTASDNSNLAGGYSSLEALAGGMNYYYKPGNEASTTFSTVGGVSPGFGEATDDTYWNYLAQGDGFINGVALKIQSTASQTWFQFPQAGTYLLSMRWTIVGSAADMGTTSSGWTGWVSNPDTGGAGTVLTSELTLSNSNSIISYASYDGDGPSTTAIVDVDDPALDFFSPGTWVVGSTGSATIGGAVLARCTLHVLALPPAVTALMRKTLKAKKDEERKIDAIAPHVRAMFKQWLSSADTLGRAAAPEPLSGKAEVKNVASPEASGLGLESATVKPAVPQDAEPIVRRVGTDSWVKVGRSDDESGLDDREKLSLRSQRGPERPQALGLREGFERYLAALAGGERSSSATSALASATTR